MRGRGEVEEAESSSESESDSHSSREVSVEERQQELCSLLPVVAEVLQGCRSVSLGDRTGMRRVRDMLAPIIVRIISAPCSIQGFHIH